MPLPPLTLQVDPARPEGVALHFAETEGVPDPGVNLLELPFVAAGIPEDRVVVEHMTVYATTYFEGNLILDASVQGIAASKVFLGPTGQPSALSPDRTQLALNFDQIGVDPVRITVQLVKTESR